jgi:hypothetical protein
MARCVCLDCGREIRYIVAAPSLHAGNNGLIAVETREEELLTEKGRLVRGFKRHICPPSIKVESKSRSRGGSQQAIYGKHQENIGICDTCGKGKKEAENY